MALIHHPAIRRESTVPDSTVHIWALSGWEPGPLPKRTFSKIANPPVVEPPAPESGEPHHPSQED